MENVRPIPPHFAKAALVMNQRKAEGRTDTSIVIIGEPGNPKNFRPANLFTLAQALAQALTGVEASVVTGEDFSRTMLPFKGFLKHLVLSISPDNADSCEYLTKIANQCEGETFIFFDIDSLIDKANRDEVVKVTDMLEDTLRKNPAVTGTSIELFSTHPD